MLSAAITAPATGATSPTGTVNFTLDGTAVGTSLVVAVSPAMASITITTPAVGTHTLVANYSGDSNYNSAASTAVTITVTKGSTTLSLTPATTTPLGSARCW